MVAAATAAAAPKAALRLADCGAGAGAVTGARSPAGQIVRVTVRRQVGDTPLHCPQDTAAVHAEVHYALRHAGNCMQVQVARNVLSGIRQDQGQHALAVMLPLLGAGAKPGAVAGARSATAQQQRLVV